MHSHGYFPQGNENKTDATLRDLKGHLYCYVIIIKSTVYVYRTTFSTKICTFLREDWGAYWKGGAYFIFF